MTFAFSRRLFLRLLGLVYLIAFASVGVQITGLAGSHGILPSGDLLVRARASLGTGAFHEFPTLLWLSSSDAMLLLLCWGGAALSLLLIFNVVPVVIAPLLWLFYLSLTVAGQVFLEFQFFNLLTIVLYLALLDDETLGCRQAAPPEGDAARREPAIWQTAVSIAAVVIACLSAVAFVREIQATARTRSQIARTWPGRVFAWVAPFRSVNGYGLFRVMTTERPELVMEVSDDGRNFKEYEFRWKPGNPARRPAFVEPHMPRLDWQMWFAALDPFDAASWLEPFAQRIIDGEPAVTKLLGQNPLTGKPRRVRVAFYDYCFTTPAERAATGAWWVRTLRGRSDLAVRDGTVPAR